MVKKLKKNAYINGLKSHLQAQIQQENIKKKEMYKGEWNPEKKKHTWQQIKKLKTRRRNYKK